MNIRTMTSADIPFGMRLKAQNNWNQLEADWQRQLDLEPNGCFVAEGAGTGCCCIFDDVAWISMILVDRTQRGQGVGTAMMRHILRYLDDRKVPCIRLDATALGQPIYTKLGFVGDFTLERYEGILPSPSGRGAGGEGIHPITPSDLPELAAFDRTVTNTNRTKLLDHLVTGIPEYGIKYVSHGQLEGYCMARPGSNAWQLGPIQGSHEAGRALLCDAKSRFAGQRIYFDVPTANTAASAMAVSLGLTVQRSFLRMTRGRRIEERLDRFWSSHGPAKG